MGKSCSCMQFIKILFFFTTSLAPQEFVSMLQVTQESISGSTTHVWYVRTCNEIEGHTYDIIIVTIVVLCNQIKGYMINYHHSSYVYYCNTYITLNALYLSTLTYECTHTHALSIEVVFKHSIV